ncbi:MAG: rRNA maturation RNase YbeY [Gemmatimonadetes bacterium]|nr:rRNA maturation RNase YbeY [Gemmatimonadota bacterium]
MIRVFVNAKVSDPVPEALIRRAVVRLLRAERHKDAEVSVTLVDDREISTLNRRYLKRRGATDVIAFALHESGAPVLGDVYIGYAQAQRQAAELGVPLPEELVRLALHGALHVLGYDHPPGAAPGEAEMERRQEALVRDVMRLGGMP